MSSDSLSILRNALLSLLISDSILGAFINGAYDYVPDAPATPYITLGDMHNQHWESLSRKASVISFAISVFTEAKNSQLADSIVARLIDLLNHAPLSLTGHNLISLNYNSTVLGEHEGQFQASVGFIANMEDL